MNTTRLVLPSFVVLLILTAKMKNASLWTTQVRNSNRRKKRPFMQRLRM